MIATWPPDFYSWLELIKNSTIRCIQRDAQNLSLFISSTGAMFSRADKFHYSAEPRWQDVDKTSLGSVIWTFIFSLKHSFTSSSLTATGPCRGVHELLSSDVQIAGCRLGLYWSLKYLHCRLLELLIRVGSLLKLATVYVVLVVLLSWETSGSVLLEVARLIWVFSISAMFILRVLLRL